MNHFQTNNDSERERERELDAILTHQFVNQSVSQILELNDDCFDAAPFILVASMIRLDWNSGVSRRAMPFHAIPNHEVVKAVFVHEGSVRSQLVL